MTEQHLEAHLGGLARRGDRLLDKYRLERFIGGGAMGAVVEAWHEQLDERVAIKVLSPSLKDNAEAHARFRREARMLFKIKSEHVCRVLDVGELDGGLPFMVMEYLDGRDMASELEARTRVGVDEAVQWVLEACSGIAQAHVRGIVHRDLKPENLFLAIGPDGERRVKLLDFGLSKEWAPVAGQVKRERKLTAVDQTMGTPNYMSPEMWLSVADAGPATDQWALGSILFELLAGEPPFSAPTIAQLCSMILEAPAPSLMDLRADAPPGLAAVVGKCLEKHPRDRYADVGALALALSAFGKAGAAAEAEQTARMLEKSAAELGTPVRGMSLPLRSPAQASDMEVTRKDAKHPAHGNPAIAAALARATQPQASQMALSAKQSRNAVVGVVASLLLVLLLVVIFTSGADPDETRGLTSDTASPAVLEPDDEADDETGDETGDETESDTQTAPAPEPVASSAPTASSRAKPTATAAPKKTAGPRPAKSDKPGFFDERW